MHTQIKTLAKLDIIVTQRDTSPLAVLSYQYSLTVFTKLGYTSVVTNLNKTLLFQNISSFMVGRISAFVFVLAIVEITAKSIVINNSTVNDIISGDKPLNGTQRSTLMDQLYEETMFRFQIEKKMQILTDKVSKLEEKAKYNINGKEKGFYAYVSRDLNNPGGGHTIVFDVEMTNFKNGYNKHTGVFTVPVDGLYSLTWVTRVECSKSYTSQLHVNKRIVGSTFAYCGYNTVTGNAVVQLRKGDVVFVRTLSGSGKIRSNEYGRTSFSGVLVK